MKGSDVGLDPPPPKGKDNDDFFSLCMRSVRWNMVRVFIFRNNFHDVTLVFN